MTSLMLRFFSRKKDKPVSLVNETLTNKPGHFHKLVVSDIKQETADCVSVAFDLSGDLAEKYKFVPGQYLTLKKDFNGVEVRRSYSICSSPLDGELRVAIKEVEGGLFSTFANRELKVGDVLDVMSPMGHFIVETNSKNANTYVAVAAGSGITPVMSIIKSVLEVEPNSNVELIYGNRTSNSVIFKEEIEDLKDAHLNRLEVHHVLSREDQGSDLLHGRIDKEKFQQIAEQFFKPKTVAGYYLCGPIDMINAAREVLESKGVDKKKIHYELFTSAGVADKVDHSKDAKKAKKIDSRVTVILDGDETHMDMTSTGKSILDAALDAGADVPFACKGAVCCTCRAKVLEGSARMEMNYALMDDEVADGYILTCQSHPTSEKVVVSYDE
jgi:ring-1,2-phenylacetyl-CoA epoxidase subunit PaaE